MSSNRIGTNLSLNDGHQCYADNSEEGEDSCAFDEDISQCDEAMDLAAQGLCQKDCPYWRLPEAVAAGVERVRQHQKSRGEAMADAKKFREEANARNAEIDLNVGTGVTRRPLLMAKVGNKRMFELNGIPVIVQPISR